MTIRTVVLATTLALAACGASAEDVPYSFELSALAQRYYRLCAAEARLQERITRGFNDQHLPMPPTTSFLESLPVANRRDAQLVCLGAAAQRLEDLQSPPVAVLPADTASTTSAANATAPASRQTRTATASSHAPARSVPARKTATKATRHPSGRIAHAAVAEKPDTTPHRDVSAPAPRVTIALDPPSTSAPR